MKMGDMEKKLDESLKILNAIFSSLPPNGFDEIEEIKRKLKEIENTSFTIFNEINKECIEFSQLNRIKRQLSQLSLLVVRCLALVEYLQHSHASFCNRSVKGGG